MGDPAIQPWLNGLGELAHPDAPRGGAGPGASRSPRPLGAGSGLNPNALPAPDSGAARPMTPTELSDKVGDAPAKTPADLEKERQQANQNLAMFVVETSEEMVGNASVGNKECAALLDNVLQKLGGKSAPDYEPFDGTKTQDYKWGDLEPDQSKIRPGDLLQFRNFETTYTTKTDTDSTFFTQSRGPQHSSIVVAVNADGSLEVVEQHVKDPQTQKLSTVVRKNHLNYKAGQSKMPNGTVVTITVSGTMWVYHPVVKPKPNNVKVPR